MSRPFHWFKGASVELLVERLIDANPATARLEVHQEGDKMTFVVVAEDVKVMAVPAPINDSFLCPPICP